MNAGPQIMSAIIFVTAPKALKLSAYFLAGVVIAVTVGVTITYTLGKRQLEERMRLAELWEDHGFVFPSGAGTPLSGGNLNRAFKALLKRAGLPQTIRFHDLRHTCATLLLRQGVNPKFVQNLLGHEDVSLTLNVYSHVLPDMGDTAAYAMDDALG
jgi:integrase